MEDDIKEMGNLYSTTIESKALEFGYKASNLLYLSEILEGGKASIPKIKAISHNDINNIIKSSQHWQSLLTRWEAAIEKNKKAAREKKLTEDCKKTLDEIAAEIEQIILNSDFNEALDGYKGNIMVRSTGVEDSADISNPGGNESHPALNTKENVKAAAAKVISSYFKPKSLEQRLASGGEYPDQIFMPILLQEMIAEDHKVGVTSGVIYAYKDGSVSVQAAPGHGELIVNSKGAFDSFYVTPTNAVHAEIQVKNFRMKALVGEVGEVMPIKMIVNEDWRDKYNPSIDYKYISSLAEAGRKISKAYDKPMDIEFVIKGDKISIVQARAITKSFHDFSALNPDILSSLAEQDKFKGATVTKDIKKAIKVDRENILIVDTIESALSSRVPGKTKAVIVKNLPPETSHEVGQLRSEGILILQMDEGLSLIHI